MKKFFNWQKRLYLEDAVYFITCKTFNNYPFFKERIFCDIFMENLRMCKKLKQFELFAWFLGVDHFHLLIRPNDEFNYSKIMKSLKEQSSCAINRVMRSGVATTTSQLRRLYENKYDILKYQKQFIKKYPHNPFPQTCLPAGRFQWQKIIYGSYYSR